MCRRVSLDIREEGARLQRSLSSIGEVSDYRAEAHGDMPSGGDIVIAGCDGRGVGEYLLTHGEPPSQG